MPAQTTKKTGSSRVKAPQSNLIKKIAAGEFVFTGELEPGCTAATQEMIKEAEELKPYVAAVNIAENPGSSVAMSGLAATALIQLKAGIECIFEITGRDQSRMGIASSLLGAAALGVKNIFVLTGDHPTLGDIPQSKPVFDLDSTQLLMLAQEMVDKHSIYGIEIEDSEQAAPAFHIGIGCNPNTTHPEVELLKIEKKITLGAEFIQTQMVFDLDVTESFFKELKKFGVPVLAGIFPMKNYATAHDFASVVPGVKVPPTLIKQLEEIKKKVPDKAAQHAANDKLNVEFFKPLLAELKQKGYAAGAYIAAVHYTRILPKLL